MEIDNSEGMFCDDRDETFNHIISDCRKPAQKEYKTGYDWVGKVIHSELCKRLKLDHTDKYYMHKPEIYLSFFFFGLVLWRINHCSLLMPTPF